MTRNIDADSQLRAKMPRVRLDIEIKPITEGASLKFGAHAFHVRPGTALEIANRLVDAVENSATEGSK